jgi:hypothetical protein
VIKHGNSAFYHCWPRHIPWAQPGLRSNAGKKPEARIILTCMTSLYFQVFDVYFLLLSASPYEWAGCWRASIDTLPVGFISLETTSTILDMDYEVRLAGLEKCSTLAYSLKYPVSKGKCTILEHPQPQLFQKLFLTRKMIFNQLKI